MAATLAKVNRKVLLIDIDPQANATSAAGVEKNTKNSLYELFENKLNLEECVVKATGGYEILPSNSNLIATEKIIEQSGVIGEKIEISVFEKITAKKVVAFNHPGNQIASIIGLTLNEEEVGKQIAMQVAAMNPIALDQESVTQDVIDRELEVGKELAIQEGKPAEMAEKIAKGRLNKFFKETTLINQVFVRDNKKTVGQFLKETNPNLKVTDFKRCSLSV